MSGRWTPDAEPFRLAQGLFDQCLRAEALLSGPASRRDWVSPAELAEYLDNPQSPQADRVAEALRGNARLRADFDHLLRRTARHALPRLAAASTGQVSARTVEGCRITLKRSQADSAQVYVIITLDDPASAPRALFVCSRHGDHVRFPLPDGADGRMQLLADEESELIRGLRDIDAEVFLR